jgi:hypothetical protein
MVTILKTIPDKAIAPALNEMMGVETGTHMNRVDWGTFASPGCHFSGSDYEEVSPVAGRRNRYLPRSMHCTTPISANRCHYWWAVAQDFAKDVSARDMDGFLLQVVQQDKEVLEAIQLTIDGDLLAPMRRKFFSPRTARSSRPDASCKKSWSRRVGESPSGHA